jgi:hypothetical protein
VARQVHINPGTVGKGRNRFLQDRREGPFEGLVFSYQELAKLSDPAVRKTVGIVGYSPKIMTLRNQKFENSRL